MLKYCGIQELSLLESIDQMHATNKCLQNTGTGTWFIHINTCESVNLVVPETEIQTTIYARPEHPGENATKFSCIIVSSIFGFSTSCELPGTANIVINFGIIILTMHWYDKLPLVLPVLMKLLVNMR